MRIPKAALPGVAASLPVGYHAGPALYFGLGMSDRDEEFGHILPNNQSQIAVLKAH
jgi:hypothetical protein